MKSIASKFFVVSMVILLALSGVDANNTPICEKARELSDVSSMAAHSEGGRSEGPIVPPQKENRSPKKGFTFPNVFDAFRSIF